MEHRRVLEIGEPLIGVFVEERIEDSTAVFAVFGEVISLAHILGPFTARQWGLVESDVADEIEGVVVAPDFARQFVEEYAPPPPTL